jgi:RNA polymerase sigma factor (sigma-70 family)
MSIFKEDAELIELWRKSQLDDHLAFTSLMNKTYKLLFSYATKFTKDRELIKDCLQNLFSDLWEKRNKPSQINYIKIYLLTSLRNNLIRIIKTSRKYSVEEDLSVLLEYSDYKNIERDTVTNEYGKQLENEFRFAIKQLSDRQQEVIFLKFYEGLSNEEIAQIMGIGRQPVANMLYKALLNLRGIFSYKHLLPLVVFLFN